MNQIVLILKFWLKIEMKHAVSVIVIRGMSLLAFSQVIYLAKVTRESPAGSRGLKVPTNKLSLKFEVEV